MENQQRIFFCVHILHHAGQYQYTQYDHLTDISSVVNISVTVWIQDH